MDAIRIDKWLWAARFYKTRSLAQEAVESGRVRLVINDKMGVKLERTKPSRDVRVGDQLRIENAHAFVIHVTAIADKRGPATFARTLYVETLESIQKRAQLVELNRLNQDPALQRSVDRLGRPTKKDRRLLEQTTFKD